MLNWAIRLVMVISAFVAGLFVARDATNFHIVQMVVALFVITLIVAISAYLEVLLDRFRNRKKIHK